MEDKALKCVGGAGQEVLVEYADHILLVTINRPEARNAVNAAVHLKIGAALRDAEHDPDVRAVILTATGDQAFCAGADLKALVQGESIKPSDPEQQAWGFAGIIRHAIGKPIIAAVNGVALGGGTEIALACDLVVAAETATFALPEVKRGVIAAAEGAFRLARQIPIKLAMEILLTGDPISADRAQALGLINAVVPEAELLAAARRLALRIVANAPLAVQATKRIALEIEAGRIEREASAWSLTQAEVALLLQSDDSQEGMRAFVEKRKPVWRGR